MIEKENTRRAFIDLIFGNVNDALSNHKFQWWRASDEIAAQKIADPETSERTRPTADLIFSNV